MPTETERTPTRRRRPHPLVVGIVAAVLAAVAAVGAGMIYAAIVDDGSEDAREAEVELRFTEDDDESDDPLLGGDAAGKQVPDDELADLDGNLGSLADYRGTPMVVNFFGSWCAPCRAEMPDFEQVHQEVGDEVAFVGLNVRDSVADARGLVEETGITYDVLRDPSGSVTQSFGVINFPSTAFVSADGEVLEVVAGVLSADELRARVAELRAS